MLFGWEGRGEGSKGRSVSVLHVFTYFNVPIVFISQVSLDTLYCKHTDVEPKTSASHR